MRPVVGGGILVSNRMRATRMCKQRAQ